MAVGACYRDSNGLVDSGGVYIFTRSGTTWTQDSFIIADDVIANDNFGFSVALSSTGNRLLVGSLYKVIGGISSSGAVYVYNKEGFDWVLESILSASDKANNDCFGVGVALTADGLRLAIGAHKRDSGGNVDSGAVYSFI